MENRRLILILPRLSLRGAIWPCLPCMESENTSAFFNFRTFLTSSANLFGNVIMNMGWMHGWMKATGIGDRNIKRHEMDVGYMDKARSQDLICLLFYLIPLTGAIGGILRRQRSSLQDHQL